MTIRKYLILSLLLGSLCSAYGQEMQDSTNAHDTSLYRFDVDFGWSALLFGKNRIEEYDLKDWSSITVNLHVKKKMAQFSNNKFLFYVGAGLGYDNLKFDNPVYLDAYGDSTLLYDDPLSTIDSITFRSSKLTSIFVEVPLELFYRVNENEKSFRIGVGVKPGFLIKAYTKRGYEIDKKPYKVREYQHFNLNKLRLGLTGRIGFRGLDLFYIYNITELYQKNKGPVINTHSFGLSFVMD